MVGTEEQGIGCGGGHEEHYSGRCGEVTCG
jgi:hypothetical protein